MEFKQWLFQEEIDNEPELIPVDDFDPRSEEEYWRDSAMDYLTKQYNLNHTNGPLGDFHDLIAVLWSALNGFPPNGKPACCIGIQDRAIIQQLSSDPQIKGFWAVAQELKQQGKLAIVGKTDDPDIRKHQYIIGKQPNVQLILDLSNNPDYEDNYHRKFGQLLGYSERAIETWLEKRRKKI